MTSTAKTAAPSTEGLHPGINIPSFAQALELAAVELERTDGNAVHEAFWQMAGDASGREDLRLLYQQAVADLTAHWGAEHNTPVPTRLANAYAATLPEVRQDPPPGWHWPVCDDCLTSAHDNGVTGYVQQASFMQEFGADLPDHTCEMSLDRPDRDRESCSCGCRQELPVDQASRGT